MTAGGNARSFILGLATILAFIYSPTLRTVAVDYLAFVGLVAIPLGIGALAQIQRDIRTADTAARGVPSSVTWPSLSSELPL